MTSPKNPLRSPDQQQFQFASWWVQHPGGRSGDSEAVVVGGVCSFSRLGLLVWEKKFRVENVEKSREILGTPQGHGTPENAKRDPYYSHTIPISLGILMGVGLGNSMGPAYHFRGSHVLGGP